MPIQVDDKVCYSRSWLRSIGQFTGDLPFTRGRVTRLHEVSRGQLVLASVDWDKPDIPKTVNVRNLSKVTDKGIQEAV